MTIGFAFGLQWLLGFLIVRGLWPADQRAGSLVLRCSLAVGLGAGLASAVWFLHLVLLGAAHQGNVLAVELVLLAALALANRRGVRAAKMPAAGARERGAGLAAAAFGIAAAAALLSFALATIGNPQGVVDALTIWNIRAHMLFDSGGAWRRVLEPSLHHVDYPLLVPITVARAWQYASETSPAVPAVNAFAFTFAAAGVCWGALRILRGSVAAFGGAAALLACPPYVTVGAMQYADVPLAFFTGATVALLILHARNPAGGRRLLLLAGASLGCAAWTKNEGMLFAVAVPAAMLVLGRRALRHKAREVLQLAIGAAPWFVALVVFKSSLTADNDLVAQVEAGKAWARLFEGERWLTVALRFVECTWSLGPGLIVAAGLWLSARARDCPRLPFVVAGLLLLGYFATYLTTSVNLEWHLGTSCQRLCLQILPVALLAVFSGRPALPEARA
ncbi:MAG TPA: phospholipid carrier-dependent glycosyltransferase [Planctomycetota bacterium]|nr:phospholipid carrier-dependent glycosyltransferase [Planctomycetota bacterium]